MTGQVRKATHTGDLKIGGFKIPCANLTDGTRLLSQSGLLKAIGRSRTPKGGTGATVAEIPTFLAAKNLTPFIDNELLESTKPIKFRTDKGAISYGYKAEVLPKICEVYLNAKDAGALLKTQERIAQRASILIRGLAQVGIIALVDEATGFQIERNREELHKILEAYISKELLPWTQRFPDEFYEEMFRLRGWHFNPLSVKRPQLVGKLTKKIIYKKLPPGVVGELEKKNPVTPKGFRKFRHHQFLTNAIGNPHLERHLASVVTLMRISPDWRTFLRHLERAFPDERTRQLELALKEIEKDSTDS